jgi:predicted HTH domain antitoxin
VSKDLIVVRYWLIGQMMQITVHLPNDLAQRPDPAREALEALAIAGYRSGELSAYQARLLLGITSRSEFEGFLKGHGILDHAYSSEDLEEDSRIAQQPGQDFNGHQSPR